MFPPLERFERREEPKAQGGEFVEAYVASEDAKNPLQIRKQKGIQGCRLRHPSTRWREYGGIGGVCGDTSATSAGSTFKLNPVYVVENPPFSPKAGEKGVGGL